MSVKQKQICRLCLRATENEYVDIKIMKLMLDILLLKRNLDITGGDPIICKHCLEVAKKCLTLKSTCIVTEMILLSSGKKNGKDIIKVLYKRNIPVETIVEDVCRFCLTQSEDDNFVSFNTMLNWTLVEMLTKYMPEMEINFIEDPIICTKCRENLEVYFKFVQNFMDTEKKIESYCKGKVSNSTSQIALGNTLNSLSKDVLEYLTQNAQICEFKENSNIIDKTECVCPKAYRELTKIEELDIKEEINLEENSFKHLSEMRLDNYNLSPANEYYKEIKADIMSLTQTGAHNTGRVTYQKNMQANIVEEILIHEHLVEAKRNESSDKEISHLSVCTDEIKQMKNNKNGSIISNCASETDNTTEKYRNNFKGHVKMHKCSMCAHQTKRKNALKTHMLVHKEASELTMYKCSLCDYEVKQKCHLNRHMLVHKDASELKMFKCFLCAYETKYKSALKSHISVHKDAPELKIHKCSLCTYETKRKHSLKIHMLLHKETSEINMHKCSFCTYEAKQKCSLESHILVHKVASEIKIYKCSFCDYQGKRKAGLTKHIMFVHKDISEIKVHKCSVCDYEAKQVGHLQTHMLVHKDVSEINMFKCFLCGYETKHKGTLKTHMLIHKDVSEIKMHKCTLCAYEGKHTSAFKRHMLVHKDISEIKTHKCTLCTYEAKHISGLKAHMFVHMDISEIKMHKCSMCTYEGKRKSALKKHMLVHKGASELKLHKCPLCTFETKRKYYLKRHIMLVHKDT